MMNSKFKIKGSVEIAVIDKNGLVVSKRTEDNLVVANGEIYVANKLSGSTVDTFSNMAVGAGTTTPETDDTGMEAESANVSLLSGPTQGSGAESNTIVMVASFPAGVATGDITEAGLFYGSILFSRVVFSAETKAETQAMAITWTITIEG